MLHLSFLTSSLYILLLYSIALSIGYALIYCNTTIRRAIIGFPSMVLLLFYISIGLCILPVLLFLIGIFKLIPYILLLPFLLYFFIFASTICKFLHRRRFTNSCKKLFQFRLKLPQIVNNILPLIIFLISFLYVSFLISYHKWPPIGDIVSHGFWTSILLYNQKVMLTWEPYANYPVHVPLGFHVVAAYVSSLFKLYPGEATFLFGGAIIVLIPVSYTHLTLPTTERV